MATPSRRILEGREETGVNGKNNNNNNNSNNNNEIKGVILCHEVRV